jgi:O-antigen/teichoic acid export membrane protein
LNSLRKLIKGGAWITFSTLVTRLAGFIVLPVLARLLGPSDLGLYNLLANTVQTGDGLSRLGIDAAIHRNGAQFETIGTESVGRLFGVGACLTTVTGCVISLCVWIWRESLALQWLGEARATPWLGLVAIMIFLYSISNPPWYYLLALHEFRISSLRSSGLAIIGSILTLFLAWQFRLSGALIGLGSIAFLQAIGGWLLTLPVLRKNKITLRFDGFVMEARSILSFGLPFYASNFLSSFIALPLLGYVSRTGGIEQLGYLRVAQSLSQLVSFLPTAIAPVIISTLSASISKNTDEHRQIKSLHLRSLWILILFISTTICFSLDYVVPSLFGNSYDQAILLSRLTIWIAAMTSLSGILGQYVTSAGQTKTIAVIQTLALSINLLVALLLIPRYSSIGLLISQGIAALFTTIAYVRPAIWDVVLENRLQLGSMTVLSLSLMTISFMLPVFSDNLIILIAMVTIACIGLLLLLPISFTSAEKATFVSAARRRFPRR